MFRKKTFVSCVILLFHLLLSVMHLGAYTARTLTRDKGPIIIRGEDIEKEPALPSEYLRLFAFRGGELVPIPFQVDKFSMEGEAILDPARETKRRKERMARFQKKIAAGNIPEGQVEAEAQKAGYEERMDVLDFNDELVFHVRDVGDRADAGDLSGEQAERIFEIEMSYARSRLGSVYICMTRLFTVSTESDSMMALSSDFDIFCMP